MDEDGDVLSLLASVCLSFEDLAALLSNWIAHLGKLD